MRKRALAARQFRVLIPSLGLLLAGGLAHARTGSHFVRTAIGIPQQAESSASKMHGVFAVTLAKPLDSKKLKEGDPVVGQLAGTLRLASGVLISSGSGVLGHVTQAQARSKGESQSSLGLVFDKIEVSKGNEIPINGVLQAIAPSPSKEAPTNFAIGTSGNSGAGGAAPPVATPQNLPPSRNAHPVLNSQSKGVLGFHDLEMGENSVLTSNGKEIKLDSGTQMMVRVE